MNPRVGVHSWALFARDQQARKAGPEDWSTTSWLHWELGLFLFLFLVGGKAAGRAMILLLEPEHRTGDQPDLTPRIWPCIYLTPRIWSIRQPLASWWHNCNHVVPQPCSSTWTFCGYDFDHGVIKTPDWNHMHYDILGHSLADDFVWCKSRNM